MRNLSNLTGLILAMAVILLSAIVSVRPGVAASDAPASLTIDVYTCDDLHDPIDPNATLLNECALGTQDIAFILEPADPGSGEMSASTGTGGSPATISFSNLAPGVFRLMQKTPDSVAQSYIAQCTSNMRAFVTPFSPFAIIEPGGRLNVELLPGEALACDWYNILAPDQVTAATLTVTVYSCSGDVIDPAICEPAADVDLRLSNPSAEIVITSDENGIATFDGEGEFLIEPVTDLPDRVFCAVQAGPAETPNPLTLDAANPVVLDAFYCYPGA